MSRTSKDMKLIVTTPSKGVRQWRDDSSRGTTRIAWATSGGRGLPRRLITLPVVTVRGSYGRRWAPPPALMKDLEGDPGHFWDTYPLRHELPREWAEDPAAPRPMKVADNCGARWEGAHHLVVLLFYDEPLAIGEPDEGAGLLGYSEPEATYRKEIVLIERFFNKRYDPRLVTRGLIRLPSPSSQADAGKIVFALASCQYPADLTDGAPNDHREPVAPSSASLSRLAGLLTSTTPAPPSLLVLAGDQVYVDATAGLFDPRSQDDRLRLPYQNLMSSPGAQSVFGLLPVATILDDHELADNWEPGVKVPIDDPARDPIVEGKRAYRRFQRMAGPPPPNSGALWYEFIHSRVPFFIADTRTKRGTPKRVPRRVDNWREARIMGPRQWDAMRNFLLDHREQVSFVVSPSMLLPRALGLGRDPSLALECDNWDGFPASRNELLALLCDEDLRRVVFLSGDAHTSCAAQATVTRDDGQSVTLWSVHSSGLYCPYPFANGSAENYAWPEVFRFEWGEPARTYRCAVQCPTWAPGDGFATLTLTGSGRGPQRLQVCFHRADGDKPVPEIPI